MIRLPSKTREETLPIFDPDELLARCCGNRAIANRMVQEFRRSIDNYIYDLCRTTGPLDRKAMCSTAHRLKGESAMVSAHRICQLARNLELLTREQGSAFEILDAKTELLSQLVLWRDLYTEI